MNGLDISAETMLRATNNLNEYFWRLNQMDRIVEDDALSMLTELHHKIGETIKDFKAGGNGEKVFSDEDVYKISNKYNHEHFFVYDNDGKRHSTETEIEASRKRGIDADPDERKALIEDILKMDPTVYEEELQNSRTITFLKKVRRQPPRPETFAVKTFT